MENLNQFMMPCFGFALCFIFGFCFFLTIFCKLQKQRNIFIQYIFLSPVLGVLYAMAIALKRQEKQDFLVGVEEKFIFHILFQTQAFSFFLPSFLKPQQVCVCLLVTAVLSRGVTLGTMTPHKAASVAMTSATTGTPCQTEWRLVS